MPDQSKNGMQCAEFDALLSDALDQKLTGQKLESFQAHARVCSVCGPLRAEAEEGQRWLKSLEEVEAPVNLVHNILVATSGRESARSHAHARPSVSWKDTLAGWVSPVFGAIRQPRFVMSFGMAFFSLSVALSMAGVKVSDLRRIDLRPTAVKRSYYETSGRVVKYYENIRLVYEIESRVRELKRATVPAEPAPEEPTRERKNNTSGQPEQKQERNYSQGESQLVLASVSNDPPVVSVTTHRRFV
jgi:hypothetical protein